MAVTITPMAQSHAASFHACLDVVARERKYLLLLQAPPLAQVERFVADNIAQGHVQVVALAGPTVVGWADILPGWTETIAHVGKLGMGLLPVLTASVSASRRSSWLASARARCSTFAQRVRGGTDLCRSSRI